MQKFQRIFWGSLLFLALLWLLAEPTILQTSGLFAWRDQMVQLSGFLAIGCMSFAMLLALRPRWPERWLNGLDKMYRLHKWLGIAALVAAVIHWLWAKGPKWAVGWGLLARPERGPRRVIEDPVEAFLAGYRGIAESLGEWAFYAAALLILLALLKFVPYRLFYKTHRLLAAAYLVLALHTAVLVKFNYWASPLGWLTALLLLSGSIAAGIVLLRRVGQDRQVDGRILKLTRYPGVKALEVEVSVPAGWPGHQAGQFAFAMSDPAEGPHPYTIASAWHPDERTITFITKGLGDHTSRLPEKLRIGQPVRVEGPYGCFTFDDARPVQIWVGGGIGITPFIGRMKHMAMQKAAPDWPPGQQVHLFHPTAEEDPAALAKLASDAAHAQVTLHVLVDARDGRLTGERIRAAVPEWQQASIWFCGPAGFGDMLKRDFRSHGLAVDERFHQELFAMR